MPNPCAVAQVRGPRAVVRRSVAVCVALASLTAAPAAALADDGAEPGGAPAAPGPAQTPEAQKPAATRGVSAAAAHRALVRAVQRRLHLKADGAYGARSRAAVRRFQVRHGLPVTGRLDRATLAALGVTAVATSAPRTPSQDADAATVLAQIAQCESGGDPTRVSPDGRYHGKYQFDTKTWRSVGGTGDADAAPEAEQDQRAAALYAKRGTAPWPTCGAQVTGER